LRDNVNVRSDQQLRETVVRLQAEKVDIAEIRSHRLQCGFLRAFAAQNEAQVRLVLQCARCVDDEFEALLARSYDRLKSVDPTINVIGVGLSPRGGDNARASSNISTSPVKFLQGMGAAYRASGRTKPLMDEFAYHPYPKKDTDSLKKK